RTTAAVLMAENVAFALRLRTGRRGAQLLGIEITFGSVIPCDGNFLADELDVGGAMHGGWAIMAGKQIKANAFCARDATRWHALVMRSECAALSNYRGAKPAPTWGRLRARRHVDRPCVTRSAPCSNLHFMWSRSGENLTACTLRMPA